MTILCVAEKRDAAMAFAQALSPSFEKKNGYLIGSNQIVYTWAIGHLLTQVTPDEIDKKYKIRRKEDLPIIPDCIPLKVIKGRENQLQIIYGLAKKSTIIYNCCDAGQEGQQIFNRIYNFLNLKSPVKRIWTSSLQAKAIQEAFKVAKDNKEYHKLWQAGVLRSESDWLIGMNASRAASLASQKNIRAGRVLLPILAIVYDREKERSEFKKTTYHVLESTFSQNGIFYKGERIIEDGSYPIDLKEVEQVQQLLKTTPSEITVLEREMKKKNAPKLLDLTELSRIANKKHGYKASVTLEILQKLYLKKVVTYPRTGSQYVAESEIPLMHESFDVLATKYPKYSKHADKKYVNAQNKHICDESKIEDHHAILPEPVLPPSDLTFDELNIYELIIERFFAQFYPESIFDHLKVLTSCGNEKFRSTFRAPVQLGWMHIFEQEQDEGDDNVQENEDQVLQELPALNYGVVRSETTDIKQQETSPPAAFTDGTLIQLMKNISRRVSDPQLKKSLADKGIGTAATRGETIKKLEECEYTQYKNRSIQVTKLGIAVIELFRKTKINTLTSPEFTALWEHRLNEIQKGLQPKESFEQKMREFCRVIVKEFDSIQIDPAAFANEGLAPCPSCNKPIIESQTRFYCSAHKEGCNFFIWKKQFGKLLTIANLKQILEKGKTNALTFTSNNKNKYQGRLSLSNEKEMGKLKMEFINK